jgi:hypothetical protein
MFSKERDRSLAVEDVALGAYPDAIPETPPYAETREGQFGNVEYIS